MCGRDLIVKHVRKHEKKISFVNKFFFDIAIRILWKFDNNLDDYYNNYPGVGHNGPTYKSPGINGYGTCLYPNSSVNQSLTIYSPPFLNMAYTSFSLVA